MTEEKTVKKPTTEEEQVNEEVPTEEFVLPEGVNLEDIPLSSFPPEMLEKYLLKHAEVTALAEQGQHPSQHRILEENPIDTATMVMQYGEFSLYEVPFIDPEDGKGKRVISHYIFVPGVWDEVTGGWTINFETAHGDLNPTGYFLLTILRARAFNPKRQRWCAVTQLVYTPKLGLMGANVQQQLDRLTYADIEVALERVDVFKGVEMFYVARDAKRESATYKEGLERSLGSHFETAQELYAKTQTADKMGWAGFRKAFLENPGWKQIVSTLVGLSFVAILLYGVFVAGWFG